MAKTTSKPEMDLARLFGAAAQALAANQADLNRADQANGDHGDNMVRTFNLITQALADQSSAAPAEKLARASQALSQQATSGSSQVYAQGLTLAARQLQGQDALTPENALALVQALLGGEQGAAAAGSEGGPLAGLLGALGAPEASGSPGEGLDLGDLLNAGAAFLNAKQQGQDNLGALVSALVSNGPLGERAYRQQSGEIVANALMRAITSMSRK